FDLDPRSATGRGLSCRCRCECWDLLTAWEDSVADLANAEPTTVVGIMSLLEKVVDEDASDLHLTAGLPPTLRVHGELRALPGSPPLTPDQVSQMVLSIL